MKSKAPLALMEQIIMLLVFALAAAICLQAFVRADALSAESQARDKAVVLAQSTAELIRSNQGDMAKVAEQLNAQHVQGTLAQGFDRDWQSCPAEAEPAYILQAFTLPNNAPNVGTARVQVLTGDLKTLFEIDIAWQEVSTNA